MPRLERCGPCLRDKTETQPNVWCNECEESLCVSCQKAHSLLKTTTGHHLVECKTLTEDTLGDIEKTNLQTCSTHPDESLVNFCNNHCVLCCRTCLLQDHASCKDVDSIEKAAEDIKTSQELENTIGRVNSTMKALNEIRDVKIKNTDELRQTELNIKHEVEKLKEKIIERLNETVGNLLAELTTLTEINILELQDQIRKLGGHIKILEAKKKHIDFSRQNSSETHLFLLTHQLKTELVTMEKQVKTIIDESFNRITYFKEADDVINSFGEIKLFTDPIEVEYKPFLKTKTSNEHSEIRNANSTIKSLSLCCEFDLDEENGFVSGMCINVDDLLLLCVRGKEKLLIYTFDGKPSGEIKIDGNPFNVSCIQSTERAVVALPDSSALQIVDVDLRAAEDVIEMPEKCWAVTSIQDKLIVAGGYANLYVLDIEGKKLEEITKPEHGRTYSLTFADNKFFYCADVDFKNEKVYCITDEGEFVFCYNNSCLKTPTEVAVDPVGRIYIADLDSNNVQSCSLSGHFRDVLLKGSDVTEPRSICFNRKATHFALSNNNGRSIRLYKIIH